MKLNRTSTSWDRSERNKINENWDRIEGNYNNVFDNITDEVVVQLVDSAKLVWKEPVESYNDLPNNPGIGETRQVLDTGKVYRFDGEQWNEIQQIDAGPVNALETRLDGQINIINESKDVYFSKFDYQFLLAQSVTTIKDGNSSRFPQSAVVDAENRKFYIARQTTGAYQDQMIYEYDLTTGDLLRNKAVPIGVQVYLEGLVYFRNASNALCFIVPVERYGKFGIFNFDTGIMEKEFSMAGNFKCGFDNHRKYFICGKNSDPTADPNKSMDGIHLYELESVIDGAPTLVSTVEFLHEQMFAPKVQGVTMIDDIILLSQGADYQVVTAIDINGNLLQSVSHNNEEIITLVGGNPDASNTNVENEGISWVKEGEQTFPIVLTCTQGKANIIQLGDIKKGIKVKRQVFQGRNPFTAITNYAIYNAMTPDGTPTIYVEADQDFYAIAQGVRKKGFYTFFMHTNAVGNPTRRSMRGTMVVSHLNVDNEPTSIEVIGQDFAGTVVSNYYDPNMSTPTKWSGWSHIGGPAIRMVGQAFDPFTSPPGVYETDSATNAPVSGAGIKTYTITVGESNRRTIKCHYSDANTVYYATFHSNGAFRQWKRVALENFTPG